MGSSKKTIAYRFDSVGNRIGMTDPDGGRFTYAYDAVNRITHLENPQGDRTTYGYDPAGRRSVKKLANGTRASFSYDAAGNLTTLANLKSDNTVISSFDYSYDRMGNRTSVVEADGSRVTWTYDATYQLTGEHRTGSHPYEDSYSYDAAGNRLLKIHDGARTTYAYDAANQLRYSEDASGRTSYTFDADGNQKVVEAPNGDRTTTSWDFENRTTVVEEASGIRNTMVYAPDGLRVKLEESTGTKKFVWDEQNYLAETDENDDTQVVYTNEPRDYGNLVSEFRGTEGRSFHFDAIGSTRDLSDSSETVTATWLYNAYGTVVSSTGQSSVPLRFAGRTGYFHDADSNLQYVRARLLDTTLGRWTAMDPLGWLLPGRSGYAYSRNRPPCLIDPSGALDTSCQIGSGTFSINWTVRNTGRKLGPDAEITFSPDIECCNCRVVDLVQVVKLTYWRDWDNPDTDRGNADEGDFHRPTETARECHYNGWFVDDGWGDHESPFYNDTVIEEYRGREAWCTPHLTLSSPRRYSYWEHPAEINDFPGAPIWSRYGVPVVEPLRYEFETCAVCKSEWIQGGRCPRFMENLGCLKWTFRVGKFPYDHPTHPLEFGLFEINVSCSEGPSTDFTGAFEKYMDCYFDPDCSTRKSRWPCPRTIPYPPGQTPPMPGF